MKEKNVGTIIIILVLVILTIHMVTTGNVSYKYTTFKITDAKMCIDIKEGKCIGETTTFSTTAPKIYVWFAYAHAPPGTGIKSIWTNKNTGGTLESYTITTEKIDGSGHFTLILEAGAWSPGDFKVDIYSDGKIYKSVDFRIE